MLQKIILLNRLKMQQYEIFQSVLGIKTHDLHLARTMQFQVASQAAAECE